MGSKKPFFGSPLGNLGQRTKETSKMFQLFILYIILLAAAFSAPFLKGQSSHAIIMLALTYYVILAHPQT
jgi:hypothetical protein